MSETLAGQRADTDNAGRSDAAEIDFVGDADAARQLQRTLPLPLREGAGGRGSIRGRILNYDHCISRRRMGSRAPNAFRFYFVRRVTQPRRVHQRDRHTTQHHARLQRITRGARRGGDNRHIALSQRIDQRRLADIRRPRDSEHQPLAQPLATAVIVQMCRHLGLQRGQFRSNLCLDLGRQVLIWKINQRLLFRQQHKQPVRPSTVQFSQRSIELAQCLPSLRLGFGSDQIMDRLRLGQIHPSIQKRAARELAGLGRPCPQRHERIGDPGQHGATAMEVKFRAILARVVARTGQPNHHRLVDIAQPPQRHPPRRRHAPAQRRQDPPTLRPTDPHHRDRGVSGSGSNGEDGVSVHAALCHPDIRRSATS